jgi:hypothetical protein
LSRAEAPPFLEAQPERPAGPARSVSSAAQVVGVAGQLGIQPVRPTAPAVSATVAAEVPEQNHYLSVLVRLVRPEEMELEHTIGIFCTLRNAFDTVNHELFRKKLIKLGFQNAELQWFKIFVSEKKQFISYLLVTCEVVSSPPCRRVADTSRCSSGWPSFCLCCPLI